MSDRRVLVLAVDCPVPPISGARLRTLHLARQLSTAFDVEVAALQPVLQTDEPFALVQGGSFRSRAAALAFALREPYQAAKLHSAALEDYARSRPWSTVQAPLFLFRAAKASGRPTILDAYDVETDTARSLARAETRFVHKARRTWEAEKTARFERATLPLADAVCAASDHDCERLAELGARDPLLVPNGVDVEAVPWELPADGHRLLFVGNFGYRPNEDAVRELVRDVLPRLAHASVDLVGRQATEIVGDLAGPRVEVHGDVDDVRPNLRRARALVVPLRAGSGTRLKVLEAMAAGVPVVSTPLGAHGIDCVDGRHALLGETAADLAAQAQRVIDDAGLAAALSTAARELVEARYSWAAVARPLVDLHARLGGR